MIQIPKQKFDQSKLGLRLTSSRHSSLDKTDKSLVTNEKIIYLNWVNHYLKRSKGKQNDGRNLENLEYDLRDGILLSDLIEGLTGHEVEKINRTPRNEECVRENIQSCFRHLERFGFKTSDQFLVDLSNGNLMGILTFLYKLSHHDFSVPTSYLKSGPRVKNDSTSPSKIPMMNRDLPNIPPISPSLNTPCKIPKNVIARFSASTSQSPLDKKSDFVSKQTGIKKINTTKDTSIYSGQYSETYSGSSSISSIPRHSSTRLPKALQSVYSKNKDNSSLQRPMPQHHQLKDPYSSFESLRCQSQTESPSMCVRFNPEVKVQPTPPPRNSSRVGKSEQSDLEKIGRRSLGKSFLSAMKPNSSSTRSSLKSINSEPSKNREKRSSSKGSLNVSKDTMEINPLYRGDDEKQIRDVNANYKRNSKFFVKSSSNGPPDVKKCTPIASVAPLCNSMNRLQETQNTHSDPFKKNNVRNFSLTTLLEAQNNLSNQLHSSHKSLSSEVSPHKPRTEEVHSPMFLPQQTHSISSVLSNLKLPYAISNEALLNYSPSDMSLDHKPVQSLSQQSNQASSPSSSSDKNNMSDNSSLELNSLKSKLEKAENKIRSLQNEIRLQREELRKLQSIVSKQKEGNFQRIDNGFSNLKGQSYNFRPPRESNSMHSLSSYSANTINSCSSPTQHIRDGYANNNNSHMQRKLVSCLSKNLSKESLVAKSPFENEKSPILEGKEVACRKNSWFLNSLDRAFKKNKGSSKAINSTNYSVAREVEMLKTGECVEDSSRQGTLQKRDSLCKFSQKRLSLRNSNICDLLQTLFVEYSSQEKKNSDSCEIFSRFKKSSPTNCFTPENSIEKTIKQLYPNHVENCLEFHVNLRLEETSKALTNEETAYIGRVWISPEDSFLDIDQKLAKQLSTYLSYLDNVNQVLVTPSTIESYQIIYEQIIVFRELTKDCSTTGPVEIFQDVTTMTSGSITLNLKKLSNINFTLKTLIPDQIAISFFNILNQNKWAIIYGSSDSGKAYLAKCLAESMQARKCGQRILTYRFSDSSNQLQMEAELRDIFSRVLYEIEESDAKLSPIFIFEDIHKKSFSLAQTLTDFLVLPIEKRPIIIVTTTESCFQRDEIDLFSNFKWILYTLQLQPQKYFIDRFLYKKILDSTLVNLRTNCISDVSTCSSLEAFVNWITKIFRQINNDLSFRTMSQSPKTKSMKNAPIFQLSSKLLFDCPMKIEECQDWYRELWKQSIVPYLMEVVSFTDKLNMADNDWNYLSNIVNDWPWENDKEELFSVVSLIGSNFYDDKSREF